MPYHQKTMKRISKEVIFIVFLRLINIIGNLQNREETLDQSFSFNYNFTEIHVENFYSIDAKNINV